MIIKLVSQSKAESLEMAVKCEKEDKNKTLDLSRTGEVGIMDMLGIWEQWYRDLLLVRLENREDLLINVDYSRKLKSLAVQFKVDSLIDSIDAIEKARRDLKKNLNTNLILSQLILSFKRLTG
jgi:hypothetical protein